MKSQQQFGSTFASRALSITVLSASMVVACAGKRSPSAASGTDGGPSSTGGATSGTGGGPSSTFDVPSSTGGAAPGTGGGPSNTLDAASGAVDAPSSTGGNQPPAGDAGGVDGAQSAPATGGVAGTGGSPGTEDGAAPVAVSSYDVLVDPYGRNPLAAVANLHGIAHVQGVRVVVKGQDGGRDFEKSYAPGDSDQVGFDTSDLTFPQPGYMVPVVGLYADRVNEVRISVDLLNGGRAEATLSIETRLTHPDEAVWTPAIQVNTAAPDLMEAGWTVAEINLESTAVNWTRPIAFDEQGKIRWALRLELPWRETNAWFRVANGNFLTGSVDTIIEVNELGRTVRTLPLPGYWLHHEILQTSTGPTGSILVAASKDGASTIEDRVLEVGNASGELVRALDLASVFDPTRTVFVDTQGVAALAGDWLHTNGLAYSATDDALIVSGRHQGVAKVDRAGNLVWLLSPHRAWKAPQSDKLLTAVDTAGVPYPDNVQNGKVAAADAAFDWPFGQHSPVLLPNNDLLLFDNGANRHFAGGCSFSRAVIYRIDEAAMTVRQIGQFVLDSSKSSCYVSNTYQLPATGNVLIQPGGIQQAGSARAAVVTEVTTKIAADGTLAFGTIVFDATLNKNTPNAGFGYSYRGHRWKF